MSLKRRGKHAYGDTQADIRAEVRRYSKRNGYEATHFADAVCVCGAKVFALKLDDDEGAAVRTCASCRHEVPIGDSADYLADAELGECACPCGAETFEITVGVSLYDGTEAVRWLYLGCRCPACGLTAVYGDWKNEYESYAELLAQV
ncbi:hypothetical protein [Polyangium aurulentum]|uniref:hypothetical protein n=1 Tax=Polyangium aurulentum TaxID=2567896 RepID=UPI0010ADE288|nr:hypothetical protein [Polyangium aurulentum]UQA60518.1 hypothetical protein E8A73_008615 [Polyangium aurulentum]